MDNITHNLEECEPIKYLNATEGVFLETYRNRIDKIIESSSIEDLIKRSKPTAQEYLAYLRESNNPLLEGSKTSRNDLLKFIRDNLHAYYFYPNLEVSLSEKAAEDIPQDRLITSFKANNQYNKNLQTDEAPHRDQNAEFLGWGLDPKIGKI